MIKTINDLDLDKQTIVGYVKKLGKDYICIEEWGKDKEREMKKITEVEIIYSEGKLEERINTHIRWRVEDGWMFKDLKSSKKDKEDITILIFEKDVENNYFYKTKGVK